MVKLTGPLQSLAATGRFAGQVITQTWKGRTYMRRLKKPNNPKSDKQRGARAMLRFLSDLWAQLETADRNAWSSYAARNNLPLYHGFLKYNLLRWGSNSYPQSTPTDPPSDEYAPTLTIALAIEGAAIRVSVAPAVGPYQITIAWQGPGPFEPDMVGLYESMPGYGEAGPYQRLDNTYYLAWSTSKGGFILSTTPTPNGEEDYCGAPAANPANYWPAGTYVGAFQSSGAVPSWVSDPAAGVAIFRADDTITTPTRHIATLLAKPSAAGYLNYLDIPPGPNTWHYLARPFSLDGRAGSQSNDASIVWAP